MTIIREVSPKKKRTKKKKSDDLLEIPEFLKKLSENEVDDKGRKYKWVSAKFKEKLINQRPDGTKVYMYQEVEGSHRLYEDGTKVYSQDLIRSGETENKWKMPERAERPPKRKEIHLNIDLLIFKAVDEMKHAKKRLVMKYVRENLDEKYLKIVKNITPAISRRIAHLVSLQNIVYEKQTKTRTVLVRGRYKYVG